MPLILAAAQPIDAIFRSVNSYPQLAAATIEGSPEGRSDAELGQAARPVLDQIYSEELRDVRRLFEERAPAGRTAVEINDLARAATFGAVDTLFVDIDANLSGTIDEDTGAVTLDEQERPGDYACSTRSPAARCRPTAGCWRYAQRTSQPVLRRRPSCVIRSESAGPRPRRRSGTPRVAAARSILVGEHMHPRAQRPPKRGSDALVEHAIVAGRRE